MNFSLGKRMRINLRFRRRTPPGATPGATPGTTPGTVAVDPQAAHPVVRVMTYGRDEFEETEYADLDSLAELVGKSPVTWVDVQGLGDAKTITRLGEISHLHPLALEDAVNTHQRPKVEDYGQFLFIVVRMIVPGEPPDTEQVSFFLGKNFVLTFQERPGDCLDPIRQRIRRARGRVREAGADYLAHSLLDAVVDAYLPMMDQCGAWLDSLDAEISVQPGSDVFVRLHRMRSERAAHDVPPKCVSG